MQFLSTMVVLFPENIRNSTYVPALWAPDGIVTPHIEGAVKTTGDWMPLFPYIIFYFMGTLFSHFFYVPTRQSLFKRRGNWERPFCFFGRHSLILYLAHQFVFTPIFMIITAILGY